MKSLADKSVMIVEDDPLIALDVEAALSDAGATVVHVRIGPEAVRQLRKARVSAALLDINLGHSDCSTVCVELARHSIPFAFYTGYSGSAVIDRWVDAPILQKPASAHGIVATVTKLFPAIAEGTES